MVTLLELGRGVQDGADIPAVNLGVRVAGETKPGREVEQRMYAAELKADSLPWGSQWNYRRSVWGFHNVLKKGTRKAIVVALTVLFDTPSEPALNTVGAPWNDLDFGGALRTGIRRTCVEGQSHLALWLGAGAGIVINAPREILLAAQLKPQ